MSDHARTTGTTVGLGMTVFGVVTEWLSAHGFFSAGTLIGAAGLVLTALIHLDRVEAAVGRIRGYFRAR